MVVVVLGATGEAPKTEEARVDGAPKVEVEAAAAPNVGAAPNTLVVTVVLVGAPKMDGAGAAADDAAAAPKRDGAVDVVKDEAAPNG